MAKMVKVPGAAPETLEEPRAIPSQTVSVSGARRLAAIALGIYQNDRQLQLALLAFMILFYGALLRISWRLLLWGDPLNLTFNSMLSHLMRGQFDVDPQIVGFEGFARNGRVYAYWGIWCALLRLPLWIIHRMNVDVTMWSCLVAVCLAGMTKVRAVLLLRRHGAQNPTTSLAVAMMLAYILLGGSEVGYLKVTIYQEVVFWAAAFAAVFVYLAVQGIVRRSFDDKTLCWMALCAGLALLTRVSTGVGLLLAFALLLIVLVAQAGDAAKAEHRLAIGRFGRALVQRRILIPLAIAAALIAITGAVNYFRWGSPTTFADFSHYLCNKCVGDPGPILRQYGTFNIRRIPFSVAYYFFPVWILRGSGGQYFFQATQFRLFRMVELPPSTFFLTDLLPIGYIAVLAIALWKRRPRSLSPAGQWAAAIAIGLLAPIILMLAASSAAYRYRMEFYPEIDFLAFLGLYLILTEEASLAIFAWRRKWMMAALAVSIAGSFAVLLIYDVGATAPTIRDMPAGIVEFYRQAFAYDFHRLLGHHFASRHI